jgi:hypothetical protein
MSLTDKLTAEKAGLESYLDSERGAKLEQSQIDRLDTLNSLLSVNGGGGGGASTSALQTTGNNSLSSIDSKLPTSLGAKTVANSLSIAIATDSALQPPTTFIASTVCLTTALSESSIALTAAKKLAIFSRTNTTFRISSTSGNTINTQNFEAILSGNEYFEDGINFTGSLFFSAETLPTAVTVAACSTTNGSATVTSANSFSAAVIGQAVSGTGIPANTFVIRRAANGLSITLGNANGNTVNATATGSVMLTFSGAVIRISRWT